MKKLIISIILLVSLSTQSTFPLLEGVKKKMAKSENIKKAKELLNMKGNFRCMRKGDNCSKEKRKMLLTVSGLLATLAALGVAGLSAYLVTRSDDQKPWEADMAAWVSGLGTTTGGDDYNYFEAVLKQKLEQHGISEKEFKNFRNKDGLSWVGIYVMSQPKDEKPFLYLSPIKHLKRFGVTPTKQDKDKAMEVRGSVSF